MLVVRGTKKLRDRLKGPTAAERDRSTTSLGDWFATALFWRPNIALLVNSRTLLPVFTELAPAMTLLSRASEAIETVLRLHGAHDAFLGGRTGRDEQRSTWTDQRSERRRCNERVRLPPGSLG